MSGWKIAMLTVMGGLGVAFAIGGYRAMFMIDPIDARYAGGEVALAIGAALLIGAGLLYGRWSR